MYTLEPEHGGGPVKRALRNFARAGISVPLDPTLILGIAQMNNAQYQAGEPDLTSWASDGSYMDGRSPLPPSNGFAIIGPIAMGLTIDSKTSSIQDAEICGIAMTLLADRLLRQRSERAPPRSVLYTDHKPTADWLNSAKREMTSDTSARHALRWAASLLDANPNMTVNHQKAHTDGTSIAAKLNRQADAVARRAAQTRALTVQVPLEFYDEYCLMTSGVVSHEHPPKLISRLWWQNLKLSPSVRGRLYGTTPASLLSTYEADPRPARLFTGTTSGATALTQLMARSGQLPTPQRLQSRHMPTSGCLLCKMAPRNADEHHIFVTCPAIQDHIKTHAEQFATRVSDIVEHSDVARYADHFKLMVSDGPHWLDLRSCYYLGRIPERLRLNSPRDNDHRTAMTILASQALTLAAHIWSIHKQTLWDSRKLSAVPAP